MVNIVVFIFVTHREKIMAGIHNWFVQGDMPEARPEATIKMILNIVCFSDFS